MRPAVFLDRDGVLTELVLHPSTGEYEPPHSPEELTLIPGAIPALRTLLDAGFELFLVSNQPDCAKGKATLEQLKFVHETFDRILKTAGIQFRDYYYCYHHPRGIVPEYTLTCECRKPKPYFLLKAARDYEINLHCSWMIGDRDTDIECGRAAGVRTILLTYCHSEGYREASKPDSQAANINSAAELINHHRK